VQRGVRPRGRLQERQPVPVGQEAAARRPERQVAAPGERDPERLPVEAPVEHPEPARVDVGG
jgi:hypothetical protein